MANTERAERLEKCERMTREYMQSHGIEDNYGNYELYFSEFLHRMESDELALERIYDDLHNGFVYGEYMSGVRFPFLWKNLWLNGKYIGFNHYGSSAVADTKERLEWVIRNMFEQSPTEFMQTHGVESRR